MTSNVETDLLIIGAGPVGLFTVFAAGMLDMRCMVVDILDRPGGQCYALYPDKNIYDVPGIPVITGRDLVNSLCEQNKRFVPEYRFNVMVSDVKEFENGTLLSTLSDGTVVKSKAAVVAAGNGAVQPRRLEVDNVDAFDGRSVFHKIDDIRYFVGKRIVIVGGGDSAVDWTIMLSDIASKIYLVHRRDKFTCFPDSESKVHDMAKTSNVELLMKHTVSGLEGSDGQICSVKVTNADKCVRSLDADCLLVFMGLHTDTSDIARWGLKTAKFGRIAANQEDMSTSMRGVFTAGDIAEYKGKLRLISNGFAEAATACHSARKLVSDAPVHFEYSTTKLGGEIS